MCKSALLFLGVLSCGLMLAGAGGCASRPKESGFLSSYAKLEPVDGSPNFLRYVAPDSELQRYDGVIIEPVQMKLYDEEKAASIKPQDQEHLEQFFTNQLTSDLKAANFNVVTTPGPTIARLRIALTDLKKSNPALNAVPQTKLSGIGLGEATMEMEFVDSQSGKQLAAGLVSQTGSRFSFAGLSQWGDVESIMKDWSKRIVARWEKVRAMRTTAA